MTEKQRMELRLRGAIVVIGIVKNPKCLYRRSTVSVVGGERRKPYLGEESADLGAFDASR
jgi:hypothetical protein